MKIVEFDREYEVRSTDAIKAILIRRDALGYNSFWLAHDELYPCISILAMDDLAYAYYILGDGRAGLRSIGNAANLDGNMTNFHLDKQEQEILDSAVIRFSSAVEIANEFYHFPELPQCIRWLEFYVETSLTR